VERSLSRAQASSERESGNYGGKNQKGDDKRKKPCASRLNVKRVISFKTNRPKGSSNPMSDDSGARGKG